MADKRKTKESNTFRFKSFAERVNEIDIRRLALYHIGHGNEELPEADETYFHQTLKKWTVLNLSDEFTSFSRKCMKIVTLPQLVHQQDFLVDLLLERLSTATNLSLQPLLELLYVLARDLREQFYGYFQRVLDRLICLLNTQDAEQLEWTLVCLAHLFKILKPHLKRNMGVVFHAILPLLDEQRYEEHVTNFAVECFSFIARDVRDCRKFLDFILETVEREQVESVRGCGRLLFEIVRGVQGRFHSVAGEFLQFLFEYVADAKRKKAAQEELLNVIVSHAMQDLLQFVEPSQMDVFWLKLCAVAQQQPATQLANLVHIFLLAAEHRNGRALAELDVVVPTVLKMLDGCLEAKLASTLQMLTELVSSILLAHSAQVTQLDASRLLKKAMSIQQRDVYEEFVLSILGHGQFELMVLPAVVSYFEQHFDQRAWALLAKIVLSKQPLAVNAVGLERWQRFAISVKKRETLQKIVGKIAELDLTVDKVDGDEALLLLLLLPHLNGLTLEELAEPLKRQTMKIVKSLAATGGSKELTILSLLLETQIHLKLPLAADELRPILDCLLAQLHNFRALGSLDQILQQHAAACKAHCSEISSRLSPLLSSHSHEQRLTAAHCLQLLHGKQSPYGACYAAECIEPNIHNYREQLLQLQQLETNGELFKGFKAQTQYSKDVLRLLLGMLYHNFKYVWEPVLKLIEQYAKVLSAQDFWDIYKQKLQQTADNIALSYKETEGDGEVVIPAVASHWHTAALNELLPALVQPKLNQQQLMNYRNLLWMRLAQFGQIAEIKNRELVTLFLDFVQSEYRKNIEKFELTWDLSSSDNAIDAGDDVEEDELDEAEEADLKTRKEQRRRQPPKNSPKNCAVKFILQTLQSKLSVFVSQANPKALHRAAELYSFYMDLLAGPNNQLQKAALDCVLAHKSKSLLPYKEQLYNIIDEKKFKDELINFKLATVGEEQREELMQILLRLLYGKMITRGTQRNVSSQVRKGLILRFLGQCSTAEILWFLQMAFGKYAAYTAADVAVEAIPAMVAKHFDLHAVYAPKKLQNVVNLLELIRKEFGGLMDMDFQLYMLKLLTLVGSVCNLVLQEDPQRMAPKLPLVYRNVKGNALLSLVNFFAHITEFDWQPAQIACLSEVYVWPSIAKLPQESIHTPTALLKLLLQWGAQPKHYAYLQQKSAEGAPIFQHIIALLLNEKAKPAVRKPIMELIEKLLVDAAGDAHSSSMDIIRPFMPQLLQRLKMNFSTRKAKQALDKRDLNILSLLTAHVKEPETCDNLLALLLPVLIAKSQTSASEEVVCQVITTLSNLIKHLDEPELYLRKVAPLFEQVQEVAARKLLCQLVGDIAKKRHTETLKQTARLVYMLNALDKRWVEQPDYEKRLTALRELTQMLEQDTLELDLGVLVIYNCVYFLRYDKDMGLRDNASEHLKLLLPKLTRKYAEDKPTLDYLVGDVIINLLRRLVRDSNDNVRQEGIRLLGELARQCPTAHEVLSDLAPLGCKEDTEVDFFENMTHLQSHRHGRALLKFCAHAETLTRVPNPRTLTQFMLPLASRYLLSEKHAAKHTLVDAAIETLGVCCQLLAWQHYHSMLRYYLMKMRTSHEQQKQCVRIVVRILDAFHFDLTQAQADAQTLQGLKTELQQKLGNEHGEEAASQAAPKEAEVAAAASLETALDTDDEEEAAESTDDEAEIVAMPGAALVLKQPLVLPPNAAKRVMATITSTLIPTLNRAITEQSAYDNKHKVNRKRFSAEREEEEILRVPIALALVKLMQKLPKELLDNGLSGVFMKVCTFLRSPLKSVRMLTRDILKKIMLTIGCSYLPMLVDHLQTLLTRGFQVHVLSVTVHGVLDALREHLQPVDIENCLGNLLEVTLNDIFGEITAEKEIDKIAAHTPEAKPSAKSYLVLNIIARNIRESCLMDLLLPFKHHLASSKSRKLTLKIQDCFAKIVNGLVENAHISVESLLIFIYGTVSESITDLLPGIRKVTLSAQEQEKMRRARPDCFIIQPAPRMRSGVINKHIKSNSQANAHILIEFGLEMLHIVLKRKRLTEVDYQPFLQPVLPLLKDALKSTHVRVTTFALKCFATMWHDEYALLDLQQYMPDIVARLFEILNNFSTFGATKQEDNLQLVKAVHKAIVSLLRKCVDYPLTEEQLDQLVLHIEQELYEGDNQTLCFALLKAMIARKVDSSSFHEIMTRLGELSITSHSDFVRDETRGIMLSYVVNYKLQKRIDKIIKFYSVQLCYELPSGRQSAIAFLQAVIKKFPNDFLAKRAEVLFLSLGTRLVNDEESACRKAVAECIELLITRLEKSDRQRLFNVTMIFFAEGKKPSVREMAAALCSRFLNAEKQSFSPRLKEVFPTVVAGITRCDPNAPGRFVRAPGTVGATLDVEDVQPRKKKTKVQKGKQFFATVEENMLTNEHDLEEAIAERQRAMDHELIQMQYCLLKMYEYCTTDLLNNAELITTVDELIYESQKLLAHDHVWVRCNAVKIIALTLASYDFELVGRKLLKIKPEEHGEDDHPEMKLDFIYCNPEQDIKSLVLDLCAQMIPGETAQPMLDETVKILLYVANMLRDVPFVLKSEDGAAKDVHEVTKINLPWLVRNIRFLIIKEVAKAPHSISIRSALFTLIEGLITLLSQETLTRLSPLLLLSLVREMSEEDQNVDADLRQQALRVGSRLRKRIGSENYDKLRAQAQMKLMVRRAERRKAIAQEKIHDPMRAAKRKVGAQERKKAAKKRKTSVMRGRTADVKQKLKKLKRKNTEDLF